MPTWAVVAASAPAEADEQNPTHGMSRSSCSPTESRGTHDHERKTSRRDGIGFLKRVRHRGGHVVRCQVALSRRTGGIVAGRVHPELRPKTVQVDDDRFPSGP